MEAQAHDVRDQLAFLLSAGNIRAALQLLNHQSALRFTALYRFGPTHAENFLLIDRDDANAPLTEDIPRDETYCSLVEAMAGAVVIENAPLDPRLAAHAARHSVQAYCGVPLVTAEGETFGTLCQFDVVPASVSSATVELMEEVARALSPGAVAGAHRRHLDLQLDRLSDMQDLIATATGDVEEARTAFEMYATPLRTEAMHRLPPVEQLEVEARIGAIWERIERAVSSPDPLEDESRA